MPLWKWFFVKTAKSFVSYNNKDHIFMQHRFLIARCKTLNILLAKLGARFWNISNWFLLYSYNRVTVVFILLKLRKVMFFILTVYVNSFLKRVKTLPKSFVTWGRVVTSHTCISWREIVSTTSMFSCGKKLVPWALSLQKVCQHFVCLLDEGG